MRTNGAAFRQPLRVADKLTPMVGTFWSRNYRDWKDIKMETTATCSACGNKKDLCGSVRIDGIQQPRVCKDCLIRGMNTGDYGINDLYWLAQLVELGDTASLDALRNQSSNASAVGTAKGER
jgi:hypothetical protein